MSERERVFTAEILTPGVIRVKYFTENGSYEKFDFPLHRLDLLIDVLIHFQWLGRKEV